MSKVHLTLKSSNIKTGEISVSTTEEDSCPTSCPLRGQGCYADGYPLKGHWNRVPDIGLDWDDFCQTVQDKATALWRHNQAGDLPNKGNDNESIDPVKLAELVKANKKKYGFTYTHKTKPTHLKENLKLIKWANKNGFTINLSANNPEHADELAKHGVPVAVVVGDKPIKKTPQGRPVAMCPYQKTKDSVDIITCDRCRLCQNSKRRSIVGFLTE